MADSLDSEWEKIELKYLNILQIPLRDGSSIDAQSQFKDFYAGRVLVDQRPNGSNIKFLTIFHDNVFLLKQLEKLNGEILDGICNIEDNWKNVTKTESDNLSASISDSTNTSNTLNKGGSTDANSLMSVEQIEGFFDKEKAYLPANALNQGINIITTKADGSTKGITAAKGVVSASNTSVDYITFLTLDLPKLRQLFWGVFQPLFLL